MEQEWRDFQQDDQHQTTELIKTAWTISSSHTVQDTDSIRETLVLLFTLTDRCSGCFSVFICQISDVIRNSSKDKLVLVCWWTEAMWTRVCVCFHCRFTVNCPHAATQCEDHTSLSPPLSLYFISLPHCLYFSFIFFHLPCSSPSSSHGKRNFSTLFALPFSLYLIFFHALAAPLSQWLWSFHRALFTPLWSCKCSARRNFYVHLKDQLFFICPVSLLSAVLYSRYICVIRKKVFAKCLHESLWWGLKGELWGRPVVTVLWKSIY